MRSSPVRHEVIFTPPRPHSPLTVAPWGEYGGDKRSRLLGFRFDFPKHFEAHGDDATGGEAEPLGTADGHINDAALDVRSAVGDGDHFGFAVGLIDHADFRAHGQGLVGGSGSVVIQALAAGGLGAVVCPNGIP